MVNLSAAQSFRLRVTFIEQGRLVYLSHLEVAHTLERTVRRAKLPFAVSQGFSPHMKIAFGAALPVGVGSVCEIFDIQLIDYLAPEKALKRLQDASVADLMVQDCVYIEPKALAASIAFSFSTYKVQFNNLVKSIQIPNEITVMRKHKEKTLVVSDYLAKPFILSGDSAEFTLESKQTGSLRPDLLLANCNVSADVVSITRIKQEA